MYFDNTRGVEIYKIFAIRTKCKQKRIEVKWLIEITATIQKYKL